MFKEINQQYSPVAAFAVGVVCGILGGLLFINYSPQKNPEPAVADSHDTEYHVHADFHIVINDTLVNLDNDKFQTTGEQSHHPDAHLHDNNGDTEHIHAEGITFVEFLDSLGITLSDDCITLDNTYCTDDFNQLAVYVNDDLYNGTITTYVPVDNDRILVYFGSNDPDPDMIKTYLDGVPHDACYYSGTCPERGIAPSEECGLTCEL